MLKVEANISEQEAVNNLWLVGEPGMTRNGTNVKIEFNQKVFFVTKLREYVIPALGKTWISLCDKFLYNLHN